MCRNGFVQLLCLEYCFWNLGCSFYHLFFLFFFFQKSTLGNSPFLCPSGSRLLPNPPPNLWMPLSMITNITNSVGAYMKFHVMTISTISDISYHVLDGSNLVNLVKFMSEYCWFTTRQFQLNAWTQMWIFCKFRRGNWPEEAVPVVLGFCWFLDLEMLIF